MRLGGLTGLEPEVIGSGLSLAALQIETYNTVPVCVQKICEALLH